MNAIIFSRLNLENRSQMYFDEINDCLTEDAVGQTMLSVIMSICNTTFE